MDSPSLKWLLQFTLIWCGPKTRANPIPANSSSPRTASLMFRHDGKKETENLRNCKNSLTGVWLNRKQESLTILRYIIWIIPWSLSFPLLNWEVRKTVDYGNTAGNEPLCVQLDFQFRKGWNAYFWKWHLCQLLSHLGSSCSPLRWINEASKSSLLYVDLHHRSFVNQIWFIWEPWSLQH